MPKHVPTNADLAHNDPFFRRCCEVAGVPPTRRQASKFRHNRGKAFRAGRPFVKAEMFASIYGLPKEGVKS